jgi:hypothetical protein
MVFTGGLLKAANDTISIVIPWENMTQLKVDGAVYPEEVNGLPKFTVTLHQQQYDDFDIVEMIKSESEGTLSIMTPPQVVALRKLKERGKEISFLDIIPIFYDDNTEEYFLIREIKIILKSSAPHQIAKAGLRTGSSPGSSVLATGDWYKIPVVRTGVHKIDYQYLRNAGLNMTGFNPKNLKLYGNGGGLLPQSNSMDRPDDLTENAIFVSGEEDGVFNSGDYIMFYGQDADHYKLKEDGTLEYEKNYCSDTSYYFLTIAQSPGLRMSLLEDLGNIHPRITSYDDYFAYEKEEHNIINSGRMWFGERFDFTTTYDLSFDFTGLVPGTELSVRSSVMGQTYAEASMNLFVNTKPLGQQAIYAIAEGTYLAKGSLQTETFTLNTTEIPAADKLTLRLTFNKAGSGASRAYLDNLIVRGQRILKTYGNQIRFRSLESIQHAIATYVVEGASSAFQVWDVTDPLKPASQKVAYSGNSMSFGALSSGLREYIAFNDAGLLLPEKALKIQNQNLHATAAVDLLIIAYPGFLAEAQRLADFRTSHDGLRVALVTTQEVYNEFSSGKQDVTAIRDFIKYVYDQGANGHKLQNVLLFGKGSFDYKDRLDRNTNFVPTYSSRNSLHPINSYSSDDYYGFMDDNEGEWPESSNGDYLMDVGIGRLPVKTIEEARIVVDKLINYATGKETFGHWRNELVFIADDGDGNLHQRDAERLATLVDTTYRQFNVNKIYVDAFPQIVTSIGESAPEVNAEIDRTIHKGGLIFNFTGHGSATRWTSETILNITSASEFKNKNRLPLFVTATCEFGRHDNPRAISGAEYLLLNPQGGAVGLLTTSRPVYSSTNFILNRAFYNNVFEKIEGRYQSIGEVFRKTKNQSLNGSVNRNFSLLADPSMTLASAKDEIRIIADENSYQPGDTLRALDKVKLRGEILKTGQTINSAFNGILTTTVFDKPSKVETLGHEDPKMTFEVRDNILFRGEVSVKNGEFEIEFIVPKNIVYEFDKGKVSTYALDESTHLDAAGANIDFVVGGESDNFVPDNEPPQIFLFINDTSFVEGGITGPDIFLVAKLTDESGISTSFSPEGKNLTAILDDSLEVNVNNYYTAIKDTYKRGWVTYPFKGLSMGTHKIRLQAWDVHNNFNEAEIKFVVVEGKDIRIEKLRNFPNPFRDYTTFTFEHNRAGDDLDIIIEVYSITGMLVNKINYQIENSPARIDDIVWDSQQQNGSNLPGGVYIFRLGVRSLSDGSKILANHKFVIIN